MKFRALALFLALTACSSPTFTTAQSNTGEDALDAAETEDVAPDGGYPTPDAQDALDAPSEAAEGGFDSLPRPPTSVVRCRPYLETAGPDGSVVTTWGTPIECGDGAFPKTGEIVSWKVDGHSYTCGPESYSLPIAVPCPEGTACTITTTTGPLAPQDLPGECVP